MTHLFWYFLTKIKIFLIFEGFLTLEQLVEKYANIPRVNFINRNSDFLIL